MDRTQRRWAWLSISFSLVVLAIVLFLTVDRTTIELLLDFNPLYLGLALLLRTFSLVFWAYRITELSKALHYRVGAFYAFLVVTANLFAGAITPGQAGGEPVRIHGLYRKGLKIGDATAVVLMERVLDGVVLSLMGVIAMLALGSLWLALPPWIIAGMGIAWAFMVGLILVLALAVRHPAKVKVLVMRILVWAERRFPGERLRKMVAGAERETDVLFSSLLYYTSEGRRGLIMGGICTAAFWSSEFLVASLILVALGQPPFVAESFLFQLIIAIVMMVPLTPGSSGVAEVAAASLYALIVPSSIVGVFVLLWRALLYYYNIVVGVLGSLWVVRREIARGPCEPEPEQVLIGPK
ncbi:MAG: flippase-like domain-containing protein [Methanospirillum sp.]|nr:flippase-like domain-containing protein [Methanospirillum sp.]